MARPTRQPKSGRYQSDGATRIPRPPNPNHSVGWREQVVGSSSIHGFIQAGWKMAVPYRRRSSPGPTPAFDDSTWDKINALHRCWHKGVEILFRVRACIGMRLHPCRFPTGQLHCRSGFDPNSVGQVGVLGTMVSERPVPREWRCQDDDVQSRLSTVRSPRQLLTHGRDRDPQWADTTIGPWYSDSGIM